MSDCEDEVNGPGSVAGDDEDNLSEVSEVKIEVPDDVFKVVQQIWKWIFTNLALVGNLTEDYSHLPVLPSKKTVKLWPVLVAMVSEMNFEICETISKECFVSLLSTLTCDSATIMQEFGRVANWTAMKTFLGNLKRATQGSDSFGPSKMATTSTWFTTAPTRMGAAGASALDQLEESANESSYTSYKKKTSVPSSTTTLRKDLKNASTLKCEFTMDPNILTEVYVTNLLKVNPEHLYTDQMWKYRTQSIKLYLNDSITSQDQIATRFVQLAKASRNAIIQKRKEQDEKEIPSQKESREPDLSKSAKKSRRN
uniref:Uncharacterized protein n=1 Tax=Atrato Denso-like virus 1 TaxID=2689333 RepID=A0A6B9KNB6_9VIRU|nr:hypothetical protein [Atrato Denso-like virus 1]